MAFDGFHGCAMCRGVAIIFKNISTGSDACTPRFIFFWTVVDSVSWVRYFLAQGDIVAMDPFEDIDTFNVTVSLSCAQLRG